MKRKVSARKRKEEQKIYALIAVVLVAIVVFVAYTQAAINSTSSALGTIAAQKSTGQQQATPQGISPQMGIEYNTQGYNALLDYYSTINLSDAQSKAVAGLDVELPCCGFKEILVNSNGTANFEASCHCGHHDAMYGLAKYMVQNDYNREQMQSELNVWKEVFFPAQGSGNLGGCA